MSDDLNASVIQQEYQARMDALTVTERMERAMAMFNWTREMIARQIVQERGPLSPERLKWEVALRQYGAEPQVRAMIQRMLDRVSD